MADVQIPLSIDQEEFSRLQGQLLTLREENYRLQEEYSKTQAECEAQVQELDRLRKAIQKSKKAKEVQALLEEKESLLHEIQTQEEEFKLQNQTVMEELTLLTSANDKLEKEIKELRSNWTKDSCNSQLLTMQAEIGVLKKALQEEGGWTSTDGDEHLKLQAAEEEKVLLHSEIRRVKEEWRQEVASLRLEVSQLSDKLGRKQESLIQLQMEKEEIYLKSTQVSEEAAEVYKAQIQALSEQMAEMEACNTAGDGKELSEELAQALTSAREELEEEKRKRQELESVFLTTSESREVQKSQVASLEATVRSLEDQLEETRQLAERRTHTINELSVEGSRSADEYQTKLREVERKHNEKVQALTAELVSANERTQSLSAELDGLAFLQPKVEELEQELLKVQDRLQAEKCEREKMEKEWQDQTEQLKLEKMQETERLTSALAVAQHDRDVKGDAIAAAEQSLKDKDQEVHLAEKKNAHQLKDLKRQLHQMQKRETRLQQQLSEMLSTQGGESLITESKQHHSRESSQSSQKGLIFDSSQMVNTSVSSETESINHETQDLLARITVLQSEKWELETKVNHLEQSNAAYAEDLLQKSALIEHYFRISKADHSEPLQDPSTAIPSSFQGSLSPASKMVATPLRFMQRVTGSSEIERLREINSKMQRCLEEALMKNISLQENLDDVLKELEELKIQNQLRSPAQLECASDP